MAEGIGAESAAGELPSEEQAVDPDGLRSRTADDFLDVAEPRLRREAAREYQRTLDLFRETEAVPEKTWDDYAHIINPPHLRAILFQAHGDAVDEIQRWKAEQAHTRKVSDRAEFQKSEEPVGGGDQDRENGEQEKSESASEYDAQMAALRSRLLARLSARERQLREDEEAKLPRPEDQQTAVAPSTGIEVIAPAPVASAPVPAPMPSRAPALLRGVAFDPAVPSRINAYEFRVPQLDIEAAPPGLPEAESETEKLLNGLISECHFLMREVALPSLCQANVLEDRRLWANTAMDLAKTGAKVAKSVAQLRHGSTLKETRHTTIIQNQVAASARVGGGG